MDSKLTMDHDFARRIQVRAAAVRGTGIMADKDQNEVSSALTQVHDRMMQLVVDYPEFVWGLYSHITELGIRGAPDVDDNGVMPPEDKECNDRLLAGGHFEPLIDTKQYRKLYDPLLFCLDLLSEFRCYAWILTKFKPRDAVTELTANIAAYLAEQFVELGMQVPMHISEAIGETELAEIRHRQAEMDRLDFEDLPVNTPFRPTDTSQQRERFSSFVTACGDLRGLAVEALNFPNDL